MQCQLHLPKRHYEMPICSQSFSWCWWMYTKLGDNDDLCTELVRGAANAHFETVLIFPPWILYA